MPHSALSRIAACSAIAACVGCGRSAPPPPLVNPPAGGETVAGNERLGWDQRAGDAGELATFRYVVYVDGTRRELGGIACAATATAAGFACSAPLPPLNPGTHTLELAAVVEEGGVFESARSAPLSVTLARITDSSTSPIAAPPSGATVRSSASERPGPAAVRRETQTWPPAATRMFGGLHEPTDVAIAADGTIFVAERSGRVRVAGHGALLDEPALVLPGAADGAASVLALALHPDFVRTRFVFTVYASRTASGALTYSLARYREAGMTLADRILLLDDVPAEGEPHASLRIGPDARLWVAFGARALRRDDDPASVNGKVLRLNLDGTTPDDAPGKSPIVAEGAASPRGIAWQWTSRRFWIADAARLGPLPWMPAPRALAATRGGDDLLVASDEGIVRLRFDPQNPSRVLERRALLDGVPTRVVVTGPDGRTYFATADALGILTSAVP